MQQRSNNETVLFDSHTGSSYAGVPTASRPTSQPKSPRYTQNAAWQSRQSDFINSKLSPSAFTPKPDANIEVTFDSFVTRDEGTVRTLTAVYLIKNKTLNTVNNLSLVAYLTHSKSSPKYQLTPLWSGGVFFYTCPSQPQRSNLTA